MALLGTWTALIPNKAIETRRFDKTTRRLIGLGGGLLLGVVGALLASNVQIGPTVQHVFDFEPRNLEPVYFGGLYAIMASWLGLTVRDRKARFRFSPILWTGLLATALMPLWPYERWYGVCIAVLIAAAVQLVSPWNERAAAYAQYVRASEKQQRRAKVVRA
jgi:predicted MFS family arabinose efflux permease